VDTPGEGPFGERFVEALIFVLLPVHAAALLLGAGVIAFALLFPSMSSHERGLFAAGGTVAIGLSMGVAIVVLIRRRDRRHRQ
jgi:small-conductance mechanosensitive channel